jgi:L-asparagine transporter-like permease
LLLWACYSIPWIALAAGTDHVLSRWRRRREAADARNPRLPARGWLSAVFFSAGLLAMLLNRSDSRSDRWTFVVVVLAVLAMVLTLRVLRQRHEAARRKREVDDPARQL